CSVCSTSSAIPWGSCDRTARKSPPNRSNHRNLIINPTCTMTSSTQPAVRRYLLEVPVTGNPYDQAWRIVELIDGNLIVTGLHGEAISNGAHWLMLLKLSPSGDIIWHRRISKQGPINYPGFPYGLRI